MITVKELEKEIEKLCPIELSEACKRKGMYDNSGLIYAGRGETEGILFSLDLSVRAAERAIEEGSLEEELRLFYVAITRARKKLFITRAARRLQRGMLQPAMPSPFLELLGDDVAEFPSPDDLLRPASDESVRKAFAAIFKMLDNRNRD